VIIGTGRIRSEIFCVCLARTPDTAKVLHAWML
jgi:hypothetical protein